MPVSSTWTNPSAAGTLDLATGAILTETWTDAIASNFLFLGGTTGRVTQSAVAVGSASGPTTISGSYADITDMSVTLTTTSNDVIVFLVAAIQNTTTAAINTIAIAMDAGAEAGAMDMSCPVASQPGCVMTFVKYTAPSAASHTWKGRWATSTGTATARGVQRFLVAIELKR